MALELVHVPVDTRKPNNQALIERRVYLNGCTDTPLFSRLRYLVVAKEVRH